MRYGIRVSVLAAVVVAALAGCEDDNPTNPACPAIVPIDFVEPNFLLQDTNPNSPTGGQDVSPRTHMGEISAWYFGNST